PDRLPDEGTATFAWNVRPLDDEQLEVGVSDLSLRTGGSSISGAATFRIGGEGPAELRTADLRLDPLQMSLIETIAGPLPYEGRLTGTVRGSDGVIDFEGVAALRPAEMPADSFTAALRGQLAMTADGVRLLGAEADLRAVPLSSLRAFVPALPLAGTLDGTIVLEAMPDRAPLAIDVRLRSGLGVVTATGTVDLTAAEPAYDVEGHILGLELTEIFAPRVPPVALTGTISVEGTGVQPATADARVRVAGRFTGWEAGPGDTVNLAADVRAGTVVLELLAVDLASLTARASGEWRFIAPGSGALRYTVDVASLEPWARYLPGAAARDAAGRLALSGSLAGSLDQPRAEGEVTGENLVLGDWRFAALDARYTLVLADSIPEIVLSGSGRGIETATAGGYAAATLDLRLTPPRLDLTLRAERTGGGIIDIVADGIIPRSGPREITIRRAEVDIQGGRWLLSQPSVIAWGGGGEDVVVQEFELVESATGGRIFLTGTVWPLRLLDAELDISRLPVGDVQQLLGFAPQVSGRLGVQASVHVQDGAPIAQLAFQLDSGAVRRVPIPSLVGAVRYEDGLVEGRALASLDTAGRVAMELQLPAEASVDSTPAFRLVPEGVVSGRLVAQELTLASFAEVSPSIRDVLGRANGEVALAGTVADPQLGGHMTVSNGAATLVPLNQRYTDISADVTLADRRLTVNGLRAYSGGPVTVTGEIVFESLAEPVADLTVVAEAFRALGVDNQEDAAFGGTLTVQGTIPEVVISGRLGVSDGYVPIPAPSGAAADFSDLTIAEGVGETSWSDAIRIENLAVEVANDVWFDGEGARAQLGGELTASKSGDAIRIQGTLEGERGTYTLRAGPIVRRFEIAHAQVRFLGSPEPNPALDITAQRVVLDPSGRRIEIQVHIGGTLSNPTLSLASADLATVPESELLSFLFFGRPSFELGGAGLPGQLILEETIFGGLAELAGIQLERTLVEDLGLSFDLFQIRFGGTGGFGGYGADVVLGWELGSAFFLTVESALGALFEGSASAANLWAIRLDWAFHENSQARIGLEPVRLTRFLRGFSLGVDPPRLQQFFLEVRRRWTY
ncbi:MAG: translocation/assembly module TamB domain-containing protein, partial [Longimicrobiales bacterium]